MPQSTEAILPRRAVVPALAAAFTGLERLAMDGMTRRKKG